MLKQPDSLSGVCLIRHFDGGFFVPFLGHDSEYSDVAYRSTQRFHSRKPFSASALKGALRMTSDEYSHIIQTVNYDDRERRIFLKVQEQLGECGHSIQDLSYDDYLRIREFWMRYMSCLPEKDPPMIAENIREGKDQTNRTKSRKPNILSRNVDILGTLLAAGVLIAVGVIFPTVSLPLWGIAICVLAWGFKDIIPYPKDYDSDYVQRYFKAQEDARLYTRAMLHQAYIHKSEIKRLNGMINGKK